MLVFIWYVIREVVAQLPKQARLGPMAWKYRGWHPNLEILGWFFMSRLGARLPPKTVMSLDIWLIARIVLKQHVNNTYHAVQQCQWRHVQLKGFVSHRLDLSSLWMLSLNTADKSKGRGFSFLFPSWTAILLPSSSLSSTLVFTDTTFWLTFYHLRFLTIIFHYAS